MDIMDVIIGQLSDINKKLDSFLEITSRHDERIEDVEESVQKMNSCHEKCQEKMKDEIVAEIFPRVWKIVLSAAGAIIMFVGAALAWVQFFK